MTEEIPMTTNPESLLAVTQEGEAIAGRLCDWDRAFGPPVPLMQDAARFIRKHIATRPAPQITSGGGSNTYDRDGNLTRSELWIEINGERWYQFTDEFGTVGSRPAPPAQPGREEVVEAMARTLYQCEKQRSDHCDAVMSAAKGKTVSVGMEPWEQCWQVFHADAEAALSAAEPLLARQDVRPEAEPVAWMYEHDGIRKVSLSRVTSSRDAIVGWTETPLYAHPATLPTEPASVREERLREALLDTTASLVAALSILQRATAERKEPRRVVASDTMFLQMLEDYRASVDRARAALTEEPKL